MRAWPRALDGLSPTARDAFVAALLLVVSLARLPAAVALADGDLAPATVAAVALVSVADLAAVAGRRRWPRAALALATTAVLVTMLLPTRLALTGIGMVVCAYTVANVLPRLAALLAVGAAGTAHALGSVLSAGSGGTAGLLTTWGVVAEDRFDLVVASTLSLAVPALLGAYLQARRAYADEVAARLARLELEREHDARAAVVEERGRIAREIHDIAAHDLSAIVVQAGAADRLVERDPDAARATLRAIREQGRETLAALRELVGVMRDDVVAQPSLELLPDLVAQARELGSSVDLHMGDALGPLPPDADLTGYRVVQEALANARQHAPEAPVTVSADRADGVVRIAVGNAPPPDGDPPDPVAPGGGHGLVGMRERVGRVGGSLSAGPSDDGGWRVEVELPAGHDERTRP